MSKTESLKLIPIAFEYLYEGMEVLDDIYNFNGKLVLMRKGDIIDAVKLSRLKNFNSDKHNIYVAPSTYNDLRDKNSKLSEHDSQMNFEQNLGYTLIKEEVDEFLFELKYSRKVKRTDAQKIQSEIESKVNTVDPADIFSCINSPRPIDEYLERHSINVGIINGYIGKWIGMNSKEISDLILIGFLHDVGKTRIPSEILDAPRKLTPEEFEIMKSHPVYSYEFLQSDVGFTERIQQGVMQHHEKTDGSGYPNGLTGENITTFAKVTAISDMYDAMVSKRSYKEAESPLKIINEFANRNFNGLDERILTVFVKNMPKTFVGKKVMMSDGTMGIIKQIMLHDIEYPIVDIDGVYKQTTEDWHCVKILNDVKPKEEVAS